MYICRMRKTTKNRSEYWFTINVLGFVIKLISNKSFIIEEHPGHRNEVVIPFGYTELLYFDRKRETTQRCGTTIYVLNAFLIENNDD